MKKITAFLAAMAVSAAVTGCGRYFASVDSEESSGGETTSATYDDSDVFADIRQECAKTLNNSKKPEVIKVILSGICSDDIRSYAQVDDVYESHALHSGVVGLAGPPIELIYNKSGLEEPRIGFLYDEDELRGIPEKNLVVLFYNEKEQFYDTVEGAELDTERNIISVPAEKSGVYVLVDAYQWYSCWGMDVSKYEYDVDKTQYESDWERGNDTGSIMQLADKDWANENAPDFHVSTEKQLASVVYYVNAVSQGEPINITLENDLDLTNMDWKPIGWYNSGQSHGFSGTIDGKGHTIKGLHIVLDYEDCGFVGYGMEVVMKDISFEDAYVSGTSCTGIAGGEIYGTTVWENVHTEGRVDGGNDDYGAIIGREASITFKDCSCAVEVNGKLSEYPSYRQKVIAETEADETFTLTLNNDYTITRDDHEGFQNLTWHIEQDGVQVLRRGAEDPRTGEPELTLDTHYQWIKDSHGKHTIYLVAFTGKTYTRVSNIIEYEN